MKLIIAGGRSYELTSKDLQKLDALPISEVISGCAPGVDRCGEEYASKHGLSLSRFPADWTSHGRAAGPIRNKQMAEYADAVALFPGGRGTESMHKEATKAGIKVFDFR